MTEVVSETLEMSLSERIPLTRAKTYNRPINHIAVSVPDIEASVNWYTSVMGFQLIGNKIHHIKRTEQPKAAIFGIYPENLQEVKIGYMSTGNGVGFELFEFLEPESYVPEQSFEYHRGGFFHVCVTDHDPEALATKMVEQGGRRIGVMVDPVQKGVKCLYAADPWGNVVEILDVSFERLATLSAPESR
jgi:catechol 2,3-dioxygenase-like lactoylglutathione lyase family enzyme